jgi:hypothetical protein
MEPGALNDRMPEDTIAKAQAIGTLPMNTHPMDYAAIEAQPGLAGNVYFLAPVNFENAAFCKIGRAKNDPEARCAQINKSSTGDVLWGVRHVVTVDDHIRFERLVHQLLAVSRNQGAGQRREIFHLPADDAFARAYEMLAQLPDIKEIPVVIPAPVIKARRATASGGARVASSRKATRTTSPCSCRGRGGWRSRAAASRSGSGRVPTSATATA